MEVNMNIFHTNENPMRAARDQCDKHINKMLLEDCQMLSTAHWLNGAEHAPYKPAYAKHPCTVWVADHAKHYDWVLRHAIETLAEVERRFGNHTHKCSGPLLWLSLHKPPNIEHATTAVYDQPQCMPDVYKVDGDPVTAYRNFYRAEKAYFAKWERGRAAPTWWYA